MGGAKIIGEGESQVIAQFTDDSSFAASVPRSTDLEFVKKFTGPNFRVKEFYTLKTRKSRLFLPVINGENASSSVI